MKKIIAGLGACALVIGALSNPVVAHDPPEIVGVIWQWPADKLPVRDGNLGEWDIIPEEFWQTHLNNNAISECAGPNTKTDPDPADLSFRWTMSFVQGSSRTHWAQERFDDDWQTLDDIEVALDADHSGGTFWTIEGMTEEESERQKGRHAQIYHIWLDNGAYRGGDSWLWFWMTTADWYEGLPWSDSAYKYTGTPGSGEEMNETSEFMITAWDDFNWQDPEGSVQHFFDEGEVIGMNVHMWDRELDEETKGVGYWSLGASCEAFGDADFFQDFLLLEIDEELMATAVEKDTWGNVKASFTTK